LKYNIFALNNTNMKHKYVGIKSNRVVDWNDLPTRSKYCKLICCFLKEMHGT